MQTLAGISNKVVMSQICESGMRRIATQGQEGTILIKVLGEDAINSQKRPRERSNSRTPRRIKSNIKTKKSDNRKTCMTSSRPLTRDQPSNSNGNEDLKIIEMEKKLANLKRQNLNDKKYHLNKERKLREQIIAEQEALSREIKEKECLKIKHSEKEESYKKNEKELLNELGEEKRKVSRLHREVNIKTKLNEELKEGLTLEG